MLKGKLGNESLARMEQLLKSGLSPEEVIRIMMEGGKTEMEESEDLKKKIDKFISDPGVSIEDKLAMVKSHLSEEAKALMEELLRQGYSMDEIMDLFLRCASNLEMIINDPLFKKSVHFSDEPPDAYLYEKRDVWTMITKEEASTLLFNNWCFSQVKRKIPFMSTSAKSVPFSTFFELVKELTKNLGLTHREIMDIIRCLFVEPIFYHSTTIRFRLGGDYAREFDDLRAEGICLQVQFFF